MTNRTHQHRLTVKEYGSVINYGFHAYDDVTKWVLNNPHADILMWHIDGEPFDFSNVFRASGTVQS
jgi:hypothetical protein